MDSALLLKIKSDRGDSLSDAEIQTLLAESKVLGFVSDHLALPEGFSYTGNVNYIVPCYNAMLLEAFTRLGKADSPEVQNALRWIKEYQVFDRNQQTGWKYDGICKHSGCMKATPCYIGIGKTVRALLTYAAFTDHFDKDVESMISKGTEYMLRHHIYSHKGYKAFDTRRKTSDWISYIFQQERLFHPSE